MIDKHSPLISLCHLKIFNGNSHYLQFNGKGLALSIHLTVNSKFNSFYKKLNDLNHKYNCKITCPVDVVVSKNLEGIGKNKDIKEIDDDEMILDIGPKTIPAIKKIINDSIKNRDFWMPFAPSILDHAADEYFADPKGIAPQFMTFAFEAARGRYEDLTAASHPKDRTIRPQVVTEKANPNYHATIAAYRERTGRGVVLNTSFNLHG